MSKADEVWLRQSLKRMEELHCDILEYVVNNAPSIEFVKGFNAVLRKHQDIVEAETNRQIDAWRREGVFR